MRINLLNFRTPLFESRTWQRSSRIQSYPGRKQLLRAYGSFLCFAVGVTSQWIAKDAIEVASGGVYFEVSSAVPLQELWTEQPRHFA